MSPRIPNSYLARTRVPVQFAIVAATALAAIPLANEVSPTCSASEPGVDVMSCIGVQRSLMQTDFKRLPHLGPATALPATVRDSVELVPISSAAAPVTQAQEANVSTEGESHTVPVTGDRHTKPAAVETAESFMEESNVTLQPTLLSEASNTTVQSTLLSKPHSRSALLQEVASADGLAVALIERSGRASALSYILVAVVGGAVFLICFVCAYGLMSENEAQMQMQMRTALKPTAPGSPLAGKGPQTAATTSPSLAASQALRQRKSPKGKLRKLCPGLVVPPGQECVLAVRTYATAAAEFRGGVDAQPLAIDVLDLHGKKVLTAHLAPPPPAMALPAFVTLLTPGVDSTGTSTGLSSSPGAPLGAVLSECRFDGSGGLNVYNASGEPFGVLTRELDRPRYSFIGADRGAKSGPRMFFEGMFHDHTLVITSENGEQLADTEPTTMHFNPQGKFYKIRVATGVDVGLVLSTLFAIDAMEASPAHPAARRSFTAPSLEARKSLMHMTTPRAPLAQPVQLRDSIVSSIGYPSSTRT